MGVDKAAYKSNDDTARPVRLRRFPPPALQVYAETAGVGDRERLVAKKMAISDPAESLALNVVGLKKKFRKVEAISEISFSLRAGERLALLGPNGAGKTTLIRCLAGRTKPDFGEIHSFGRVLPASGGREELGLVPQDIAIYGDLTTRENLVAFARFQGLRGRELAQRVEWALQWTGLEARKNELVAGFSGGMKRRVNLACGVMHSPKVLLLDEPTVGVDPQSRQRIFEMLDQLRDAGTSILLTTHHLDEAEQRCDRIVIIDHGRVVAQGTLEELIRDTVGTSRHVRLRIDRPWPAPIAPWHVGPVQASLGDDWRVDDRCLQTRVTDVAGQLPGLLQGVSESGYTVQNVEVQAPSLHDVFLHLTGQALRD
jgi:ABC-2 type transport system ATP-binding protein